MTVKHALVGQLVSFKRMDGPGSGKQWPRATPVLLVDVIERVDVESFDRRMYIGLKDGMQVEVSARAWRPVLWTVPGEKENV